MIRKTLSRPATSAPAKSFGLGGLGLGTLVMGALAGAFLAAGAARADVPKSYTFLGLPWGSSQAQVRSMLAKRRFRVVRAVGGPVREFTIRKYHGNFVNRNRGRRLVAVGRVAGQPVHVDLAFGDNDKLAHVIVKSPWWNRTVRGARKIITMAKTVIEMYRERFGQPKIISDDGWPDTANWQPAADGSRLHVYVRGEKGFMFSPSYKTGLRVHFYNPNVRSNSSNMFMGGGTLPDSIKGPALAKRYRAPKPRKLSGKEQKAKDRRDFRSVPNYRN